MLNEGLSTQMILIITTVGGAKVFTLFRFSGGPSVFTPPVLISTLYLRSLNLKPNIKSHERHDLKISVASQLMIEPTYSKAFSESYGPGFRRDNINKFKSQNSDVITIRDEISSKRAEVVEKTPFESYP